MLSPSGDCSGISVNARAFVEAIGAIAADVGTGVGIAVDTGVGSGVGEGVGVGDTAAGLGLTFARGACRQGCGTGTASCGLLLLGFLRFIVCRALGVAVGRGVGWDISFAVGFGCGSLFDCGLLVGCDLLVLCWG
jgi:hypothetical protein